MSRNVEEPEEQKWRVITFTILVILSTYLGSAMVDMLF
jgi:hypothetical protein